MEAYRRLKNIPESHGIPWNIMESDRTLWNMIEGYRSQWNVPEQRPIEGCRKIQKDIEGDRRLQKDIEGYRRRQKAVEGHRTVEQSRIFSVKKYIKNSPPGLRKRQVPPPFSSHPPNSHPLSCTNYPSHPTPLTTHPLPYQPTIQPSNHLFIQSPIPYLLTLNLSGRVHCNSIRY